MITVKEFLAGESLDYRDHRGRAHSVTYRIGEGIYVDDGPAVRGIGDTCTTDVGAARVYHSITRRNERDAD